MAQAPGLTCICCGGSSFHRFRTIKNYKLYKCDQCGFVRVAPLPGVKQLEEFYNQTRTEGDNKSLRKKLLGAFMGEANNPKRDYFGQVLAKVSTLVNKTKFDILEIGAGFGYFIHYANTSGHKAIGTEMTREYAEMSSEDLNGKIIHVEGDRYADHFAPASVDLIYMEHVFEHVLHPQELLVQIKRMLKPGGVFFVAVPNINSMSSKFFGKHWSWGAPPDHLYFYNPENLSLLLQRNGFEIIDVSAKDYPHRSIPQLYSLRKIFNIVRKLTGRKPKPYSYRYPVKFGDFITLLPYYIFNPFIRRANKNNKGNELIIFARCPR
ncbi:MAG: class I SAM-dependent methyltransferase [Bacteroidia bacterium]